MSYSPEQAGRESRAVINPDIRTLADFPRDHARRSPERTALVFGATRVSFAELDQRSSQVANALCDDGVPPQATIAFLDRNSEKYFYLLFGAAKANVSLATVNFRLTAREVHYILEDCAAQYLVVGCDFLETARECQRSLPTLRRIIVIDGDDPTDSLQAWIGNRATTPPAGRAPAPGDRAMQMYTSGTTGHPKGVMLSHDNFIHATIEGLSVWPVMHEPDAAVLATMPLFHIAATNLCLAGLYAGGRAEILREASAREIVRLLAEHRIRIVPLPPALIHEIIRLEDIGTFDLSHLDTLLIAGSGIAVELLREAQSVLQCGFALSYGMTECCGGLTYLGPEDCKYDAGKILFSAGRPLMNCAVRIVDGNRRELPVGTIGEIACQTDRVMIGYWNNPQATAEVVQGGWYYSGDAGYVDDQGYLYVVDRIKDMVISGGENIYPAEIENELVRHPAVSAAAVIGVPDPKWGEALLACVILNPGKRAEGADLERFLRGSLAGFKVPRRYEFMEALPRNATGKVLKRELRKRWS